MRVTCVGVKGSDAHRVSKGIGVTVERKPSKTLFAGGIAAALIAGMLGTSSPALAADSTVSSVGELKTAVEALAAGPSTITFAADFAPVGASPTITIPAGVDLTLAGTGEGTTVTKEAGADGRHIDLVGNKSQTVTVTGLTFKGHNSDDPAGQAGGTPGGGVGIREVTSVDVSKSTFAGIDGSSGLALGGVATLTVSNSSFMGNRSAAGAAIELPNGVNATITDTTMHKNWGTQSGFSGGALRPQRKTNLTIERSVFTGNVSLTRGGAIAFHQMEGSLTVHDSVFSENRVPIAANNSTLNDGGAIAVNEMPIEGQQSGKTLITGTTFSNNVAGDEGGALLIQSGNGSEATIQNSTFYANRAEGKQATYDDTSGGGAIEAFGTPLTLEHNTFVNNFAHKGTSLFGHQRGGAVSATGDTAFLQAQPLTLSHNLFVGNDVGFDDGSPAPSSAYRQVSARGGIETLPAEEDTVSAIDDSPGAPALTRADLLPLFADRAQHPADGDEADFMPFTYDVHATNVGVDNGTAIDPSVINRAAILGADDAVPAANGSGVVAGDSRTGTAQTPGTFLFHPADDGFLTGLADNVGDGTSTVTTDQRKFPVDDPADAGALQQAFVRYDPNGGDWADYTASPFDGERIVQRPDAAMVWTVGTVGSETTTEPVPTTPPTGKTFVEWNTKADGSGDSYQAGTITIPAGNLRLYAIWEAPAVETGTVTAEYLDENGDPLRDPVVTTGDVGTDYTTQQLTFDGYDYVRVEGSTSGTITAEPTTVRYYYKKQAAPVETGTVKVEYVDEHGAQLRAPISLKGKIGDPYTTEKLAFDGYDFVRVDGATTGEFTSGVSTVRYHYTKHTTAPPVVKPGEGGPLADSGLDFGWPIAVAGGSILLVAAGLLLYGRRRQSGDLGS